MQRLLVIAVLVLTPSAAFAGGGGGSGPGDCAGFSDGGLVVLRDFCLDGAAHFAEPGTLTVRNEGDQSHDYTDVGGTFATGLLRPGEEAQIDVEPGAYRVYCTLHASRDGHGMAGALVAVGDPAGTGAASASGTPVPWAPLALLGVGVAAIAGQRARATRRASRSTS